MFLVERSPSYSERSRMHRRHVRSVWGTPVVGRVGQTDPPKHVVAGRKQGPGATIRMRVDRGE